MTTHIDRRDEIKKMPLEVIFQKLCPNPLKISDPLKNSTNKKPNTDKWVLILTQSEH